MRNFLEERLMFFYPTLLCLSLLFSWKTVYSYSQVLTNKRSVGHCGRLLVSALVPRIFTGLSNSCAPPQWCQSWDCWLLHGGTNVMSIVCGAAAHCCLWYIMSITNNLQICDYSKLFLYKCYVTLRHSHIVDSFCIHTRQAGILSSMSWKVQNWGV